MSATRFGRAQKATTLVPLALLSAAWTANLAGVAPTASTVAVAEETSLPDGTAVPAEPIEAPASVSSYDNISGSTTSGTGDAGQMVATSSTAAIPSAALSAYQRAETVINSADPSCNLTWQLIAAIGRVESNHGRFGGNALDDQGVARPGIYGIPLNGKQNTRAVADTDAGQYDLDATWDRAIGPMQFIPSTWSVVGVDADGDDERNPQDIDDAALASAVYLCSGKDDLSTTAGQRASVFRYNHSWSYVDLVLSIMDAYLAGDFTSIPNGTTSAGYFVSAAPSTDRDGKAAKARKGGKNGAKGNGGASGSGDGVSSAAPPPAAPPGKQPPAGGGGLPGPGGGTGTNAGTKVGEKVKETVKDPVGTVTETVEPIVTTAEARTQCLAELGVSSVLGLSPTQLARLNECIEATATD